jgi:hypothetical protein
MDNVELAKQITVLQDIEAIKKLKAEYCDICDDDHNQERIVTIFARGGIWEGKGVGYAKGHAGIRKLFKRFSERISFSQHNVFNPRIEVKGSEAHAIWYFLGVWKIKHLRAIGRMTAPYEEGWASRAKVDVSSE